MAGRSARLAALGIAVALGALAGGAAEGQRPARPIKIGALTESWGPTPHIVGLRDGLKDLGYVEDRDFTIGVRFTQGNPAELPAAARDLVRLGVDIMVVSDSSGGARAAQMATDRIPIVFMGGTDPVAAGLVRSFARPGGNITGVVDLDMELAPKRMELFRELVPGLKRVLFAYDASSGNAEAFVRFHRDAARRLGLTLLERPVRTQQEAQAAILGVRKGEVDGILSPRMLSLNIPGFILDVGASGTLPTMFHGPFYVERGGLASYAASYHEIGRQGARLVDRILKGAKPADIPVEQPTKFELVINLKTAGALGLTVPQTLLLRADRLIR